VGEALRITLNGEPLAVPPGTTLGALVDRVANDRSRIAVERNRAIVPRARLDAEPVRDGDVVEVVTLVGGG
jgi:sulfur carrier protein